MILYHVNAFTKHLFGGNPAAVCLLTEWLPESVLNDIAKENNLPVTTFLIRKHGQFNVRWITPEYELTLCGHGSLAAGHVIFNYLEPMWQQVELHSAKQLITIQRNDDLITLKFPIKQIEKCHLSELIEGLGSAPLEMFQHQDERCLAIYDSEDIIRDLRPNMEILKKIKHTGITVSAPGNEVDFVSRTFYPKKSISEDPATGASHCILIPYWANRLNKINLHAKQVSQRGGEMFCEYQNDHVLISGHTVLYLKGEVYF